MMKLRRSDPIPPLDVLIFDMDGVLIDVSKSYRKTIQKTVQIYFATCLGLRGFSQKLDFDEAISLFSLGRRENVPGVGRRLEAGGTSARGAQEAGRAE